MMRNTIALLVVVGLASAARLTWNSDGCNTDFNNKANWEPKRSPKEDGSKPVARVIFGTQDATPFKPVNSFVVSGEYSMGELILPEDGILTLEGDGVTLNFVETTDSTDLYFAAGQKYSEACDFNCHKNWNTLSGAVSKKPACDGDVALFSGDHTHKVWAEGIINLQSIKFGDDDVSNKFEIPEFQIYPEGDLLDMIFQDNSNCEKSGLVDSDQRCFCHSTCLGEADQLVQNNQQRAAARLAADEDQKEILAMDTKEFFATFNWFEIAKTSVCAGIPDSSSCLTSFGSSVQCAFAGYNFTSDAVIAPGMETSVSDNVPLVSINVLSVIVSGNEVRIGGDARAPYEFFNAPGPNGEMRRVWSDTWTYKTAPGADNLIASFMWKSLARSVLACSTAACAADVTRASADCDSNFPGLCSDFVTKGIAVFGAEADVKANVDKLIQAATDALTKTPEASLYSVGWDADSSRNDLVVMAGDRISFAWAGTHDVARVSKATYDQCTGGDTNTLSLGNDDEIICDTNVNLCTVDAQEGTFYYISTVDNGIDCSAAGIRIQVTVGPFVVTPPTVSFTRDVITVRPNIVDKDYAAFLTKFAAFLNAQGITLFAGIQGEAKKFWDTKADCLTYGNIASRVATPLVSKGSFPGAWAGIILPQYDVNQIVNPLNKDVFKAYLAEKLVGIANMTHIENVQVELRDPKADRRRNINSSAAATILLWVTFDYTKYVRPTCKPGEDSNFCLFVANSKLANFVGAVIDDLTTLYEIVFPACFSTDTVNPALPGYDSACIAAELKKAILDANKNATKMEAKDRAKNEELAAKRYLEIARCGMKGAAPDGTCLDPKSEAAAKIAAAAAAKTAYDAALKEFQASHSGNNGNGGSQSSTGSSGGGLPIIPIAAGGGGFVLILIIVIIVIRRRKNNVAPKGTDGPERTVVAFENPMYDDPGQNTTGNYDAGLGGAGESEGLYDEPAFSQAAEAKQNPMYQSSEDLHAGDDGEGETGGGYLDVAPEDQ